MEQAEPNDYVVATYEEIRLRFGLGGTDQARIKAKRRKWPAEPPNYPGAAARIRVPRDAWDTAEEARRVRPIAPDHFLPIRPLEDAVVMFREEQARAVEREERLRAELAEARAEAGKLTVEAAAERTRTAVAEAELKGLREALAEARRPFWRRWIS